MSGCVTAVTLGCVKVAIANYSAFVLLHYGSVLSALGIPSEGKIDYFCFNKENA